MTARKARKAPDPASQSQSACQDEKEPDPHPYSDSDLERVAAALGVPARDVRKFRRELEEAALWYRLGRCRPHRTSPALQELRAKTIGKAARKLLGHLGVSDPAEAEDGPGDMEIAELLGTLDGNPDAVVEATARIGRLVEVCDAIEAAAALHRRAENGAKVARRIGDLTVRKGHAGNDVLNDWIAALMSI